MNRNTKTEQIVLAIQLIKEHDMKCIIDLILGLPGLTEEDVIESLHVLHEATPDFIRTFWLRYYPRTDIIDTARAYGLLSDQDIRDIETAKDIKGVIKGGHTCRRGLSKYANFLLLYPVLPQAARIFLLRGGLYSILGFIPAPLMNILLVRAICSLKGLKYHTYADRAKGKYKEFIPRILAQKTRYVMQEATRAVRRSFPAV